VTAFSKKIIVKTLSFSIKVLNIFSKSDEIGEIFRAFVLGSIGGGLCGFSKEDGVIPVNKNLW
jgi:hypothetical protein